MFDLKEYLTNLMGGGNTSTPKQSLSPMQNPRDPASRGYAPEITYNPNPNTNIPYSARSMEDAQLGNEYMKNPQHPKFLGVDPKRFGFPADGAPSIDNQMTNRMVDQGRLPENQREIYPQRQFSGRADDPIETLRRILGF